MPNGHSDLPPPYKPSRDGEPHELRADCSATFGTITATLRSVSSEVKAMRGEVSEIGKSQVELGSSTRGLWHEVRDEINPGLKALPDRVAEAVTRHATECPARRKAMKRAESDSDDALDVRAFRGDATGSVSVEGNRLLLRNTSNGHYEIPRPVLWIGALIGTAVATSGWILQMLGSGFGAN